jgi:hypothetical protein
MTLEQWIINTKSEINQETKKEIPITELEKSYNSILLKKLEFDISFKESYYQDSIWEFSTKLSEKYFIENKNIFNENISNFVFEFDLFQKIFGKIISSIFTGKIIFLIKFSF